jgi:hypothetical protein
VPGPLLQSALAYVNDSLQRMADAIQARGEADSTAIILTAKHGQSPLNNSRLQRIDDGPIISGVNAAWADEHPSNPTLVVQEADDDGLLWWLSDRSQQATEFVKNYLWTRSAPAVNYAGQTVTVQHSGLKRIFAGEESARFFGVANSDPHHPDVFGISQVGTIYTTGSKIAEHGGDNPGDRDVPWSCTRRVTSAPASSISGSRRRRSRRRSCACSGSTRRTSMPSGSRERGCCPEAKPRPRGGRPFCPGAAALGQARAPQPGGLVCSRDAIRASSVEGCPCSPIQPASAPTTPMRW